MTARACAFCGQQRPPTLEHIWPRCIIARTPTHNARYYGRAEKFVEGELTIKDVCAACNNGPLSTLDAYICKLYDAHFSRLARRREPRTFLYDYSQLLRWLLKISYNSARANHSDTDVLQQYAKFILDGGIPPLGVEARLELIYPSKNPKYVPGSDTRKTIPPDSVRCCRIAIVGSDVPKGIVRLVAIKSFYFWILLCSSDADISRLREIVPGTTLRQHDNRVSLFPSRGMLEMHADWATNARAMASMKELRARRSAKSS